jgi:hypothetical protein
MRYTAGRILLIVVILAWGGLLAPPATSLGVVAAVQQDPQTITVYVTRTGKLYHRDGCQYLRQSKIAMSLAEAAKRYGRCSVCKPPTVRRE